MGKDDLIGKFSLPGGGGIRELASKISGEKPLIVRIKKDNEEYSVSSLEKGEIPDNLEEVMEKKLITAENVDVALFTAAQSINSGLADKYFLRRVREGPRSYYEFLKVCK